MTEHFPNLGPLKSADQRIVCPSKTTIFALKRRNIRSGEFHCFYPEFFFPESNGYPLANKQAKDEVIAQPAKLAQAHGPRKETRYYLRSREVEKKEATAKKSKREEKKKPRFHTSGVNTTQTKGRSNGKKNLDNPKWYWSGWFLPFFLCLSSICIYVLSYTSSRQTRN